MESERYVVREATTPQFDWLPDWVIVDTERKVRAAAYDDEESARVHCAELNAGVANA